MRVTPWGGYLAWAETFFHNLFLVLWYLLLISWNLYPGYCILFLNGGFLVTGGAPLRYKPASHTSITSPALPCHNDNQGTLSTGPEYPEGECGVLLVSPGRRYHSAPDRSQLDPYQDSA